MSERKIASVLLLSATLVMAQTRAHAQECAYLGATENFNSIAYCVSSALSDQGGRSYGPGNLFDMSASTAWCEGVRGSGAGEMLTLRIDNGGPFRRIFIQNGYQKSRELFLRNARPRTLEIRTDTGLRFTHVLDDSYAERMIDLPEPGEYRTVQIRVLDVYPGSRYEDMCISTLLVDFDYEKYLEFEEQSVSPETSEKEPDGMTDAPTPAVPGAEALPELPEL